MDTSRAGEALSRPGMDPRPWASLAVVTAVNVTDGGTICDVTTLTGIEETASYTPVYGGSGYGLSAPIEVGSMVLISIPEGEFATGARVIAHVWDHGSPPPALAVEHPEDMVLVVRPGKSLRILVAGGGNVVIAKADDGTILLGAESASRGVARINDEIGLSWDRIQTILDSRYAQTGAPVSLSTTAGLTPGADGAIATASSDVKST